MPDESSPDYIGDEKAVRQEIADNLKQVFSIMSEVLSKLAEIDPDAASQIVLKVFSAIAELVSALSPDPIPRAIEALFDVVHKLFTFLDVADALTQLSAKKTFLDDATQDARTAFRDLQLALNPSTIYSGDKSAIIILAQTSLNHFLSDDDENLIWNSSYSAADARKIYWTDAGRKSTCWMSLDAKPTEDDAAYGAQKPPLNDDGVFVFDYLISLPIYLLVLDVFLAAGLALDPNFRDNMKDDLANHIQRLQSIYDKVVNEGLTLLSPPDWTGLAMEGVACPYIDYSAPDPVKPRPAIQLQYEEPYDPHHPKEPKVTGASIEYGVVEKFSGFSSIDDAYQLDLTTLAWDDAASYPKLQARLLKRKKDVYVTCGMNAVFHAINRLSALTGSPIRNPRSIADWSLREVLGISHVKTGSLRDAASFFVRTQPFDTPYTDTFPNVTVSLRQLLSVPQ